MQRTSFIQNFLRLAQTALVPMLCAPILANASALKDVHGPASVSTIPEISYANLSKYDQGSESRLAVLVTDVDSAWLGVANGLKTIGIPFRLTQDYKEAIKHKAVFVYPAMSGKNQSPEELKALADYARSKGTLIAQDVIGGGLEAVFGFDAVTAGTHTQLRFDTTQPEASEFTATREKSIPIGNPEQPALLVGTYSYTNPRTPPLAVYEDGSAAITQRHFDSGSSAYALGVDLGFLLNKGYDNREEGIARSYVNDFEPMLDTLLRLLKNIYVQAVPEAVTLNTVPDGKSLSVILTHDIDYTHSVKNSLEYARLEKSFGIAATYFMQTKYVKDWNDDVFFNDENITALKELVALGADLESHSVSHSRVFSKFEPGTGREQFPGYQPFVKNKTVTLNGSVLGELRVSKFLLESTVPGTSVSAFRPGHLSNPYSLPQSLLATGYRYSSSVTANDSLTHLPFQLTKDRASRQPVDVYEFPVTVEDEAKPKLGDRLDSAVALAHQLRRYGGLFVILIHPDILDHKLAFEQKFIEETQPYAWFGTLAQFGAWWAARDTAQVDLLSNGAILQLSVTETVKGLSLKLPQGITSAALPPGVVGRQNGNVLVVDANPGTYQISLTGSR